MLLKIYKNIDELPISNWHKVLEDDIDMSFLIKNERFRFLKRFYSKELTKYATHIMEQLENIDLEVYEKHYYWHKAYVNNKAIELEKEILGTNPKINNDLEESFKDYIRLYQKKFVHIKIIEYYFCEDYELKFKELLNIDINKNEFVKGFHKFKDIKFYTKDEFVIFCHSMDNLFLLKTKGIIDLIYDNFIESREIELTEIEQLDEYLLSIYMEHHLYDLYQDRRMKLFSMGNLSGEREGKVNIIKDMEYLNTALSRELKITDTVRQLETLREIARDRRENQKPNNGTA